jgi:tryptophan synthase beta subunit
MTAARPAPIHVHNAAADQPARGIVGIDAIRVAAERLDGVAHRTPMLTSRTLDTLTGATVLMKAENFQRAGAFKFRGAYNKIASLTPEQLARGVCTWSSGNHAQAVALAASLLGTTATVRPLTNEFVKTSAKALRDFEGCDCGLSLCLYVDRSCPTTVMKTGL